MRQAAVIARELQQLLTAQAQALRDNRADDLPALEPAIRRSMRDLAAHVRFPLEPSLRADLAILKRLAGSNATWLARRRNDAAAAIQSLASAHAGLRQHANAQTYGAQGQMNNPGWRGGFGRA